ncbi:MAG: hypothetical protein AB1585_21485 [Thermodesulfobacteriota bacterium]
MMKSLFLCFRRGLHSRLGIKMAIAAALLYLIYSQNILFVHVIHHFSPEYLGKDSGSLYEERMSKLRPFLPVREKIGYVSDAGLEFFLRAQYALAPVILTPSPDGLWIVANYSRPSARPQKIKGKAYTVIKEYDDGLSLLNAAE